MTLDHRFCSIITPYVPSPGDPDAEVEDFFLPMVLLWCPYSAFSTIFPEDSIKCPTCGCAVKHAYWNDGSSARAQPRLLHDSERITLLVSATYVCVNNHRLLAHDESILKLFPEHHMIPFELLHRAGFTRNCMDTCIALVTRGLNFHNVESFIAERRWEAFERQKHLVTLHQRIRGESMSSLDFWSSPYSNVPSNDLISKCFLGRFLLDEKVYVREMLEIPSGDSISFDHTFKVAANIGFNREDGRWIQQYDSLFLVMSDSGKVVAWQLTKGTGFAQIEVILRDLKERSNDTIKTIYIDDCCKLRTKIQSVFGSNVRVKLDVFHAVQRISKTLVKRHALLKDCLKDFQLVFRKDGDSGDKRQDNTPPSDVILAKLNKFVRKCDSTGMHIFSSATVRATQRLEHHVKGGCLSDIPPGRGTNRNERIHHHINALFNKSKSGILLAYALLTVVLYSYNSTEKKHGRTISRPITTSSFYHTNNSHDMHVIGIVPNVRKDQTLNNSNTWEIDISESIFDMQTVLPIYLRSLRKYHIYTSLKRMGLSNLQNHTVNFTAYSECEPAVFKDCGECDLDLVKEKLSTYGLTLALTPPDGDCFFTAFAMNLLSDLATWSPTLTLAGLQNHEQLSVEAVAIKLRHIFVNELFSERRANYEAFVTHTNIDYEREARMFLTNGYFDSELGNVMPLALSTALQLSCVIFTRDETVVPPLYITPEIITTEATVFLVYTSQGKGHYDAAIVAHSKGKLSKSDSIRCRCGVNKRTMSAKSCQSTAFYISRCKCLKQSKACGLHCQCAGCANPFGRRLPAPTVRKRTKRKHTMQVPIPNSQTFANQREEKLSDGVWSSFETIALHETLGDHKDNETSMITKIYNDVVSYSTEAYCVAPVPTDTVFRKKTEAQVTKYYRT